MTTKLAMLALFAFVSIAVGFYYRKQARTVQDFVLGGLTAGPWLSAFSYGTAYFSAVIFVGYAGQFGWRFGIASTWIGIANALIGSYLAWMVLGRRTRIMTRHLESATMPDFFGTRFESKGLKLLASAIIFVFLIPYSASLYNGLSRIFEMAFAIDYTICVLLMALLTAIYVVQGGYLATAVNNLIQGIVMLFGIVAVIFAVLDRNGGFAAAISALSRVQDPAVSSDPGVFASFFGADFVGLLSVMVLTSLGTWGMPQMVHKYYAIKNETAIRAGTVISTLFALVVAGGCYFLGGFSRLYDVDPALGYDAIIPHMLENLPDWLIGIVVMLVFAASMSTLSSLVLISSSTLTLDFLAGFSSIKMKEKGKMLSIRLLVVVFIVLSVAVALIQYTYRVSFIAGLMGVSWGALAGSFLGPLVFGLYWKRTTTFSVFMSFLFGVGLTTGNMFFHFFSSPVVAGAVAMLLSFVVVFFFSLVSKKPDAAHVDWIFSCYEEKVAVKALVVEDEKKL